MYSRQSVLSLLLFSWPFSALSDGSCFKLDPVDGGSQVSNLSMSKMMVRRANLILTNVSI